jgi:hypothetical protein
MISLSWEILMTHRTKWFDSKCMIKEKGKNHKHPKETDLLKRGIKDQDLEKENCGHSGREISNYANSTQPSNGKGILPCRDQVIYFYKHFQ